VDYVKLCGHLQTQSQEAKVGDSAALFQSFLLFGSLLMARWLLKHTTSFPAVWLWEEKMTH